jgi:hypothetical protein
MAKKITQAQRIRDYFTKNPGKTVPEAAKAMGIKYQIVYMTKRDMDKRLSELAYQIGKGRTSEQKWETVHISTSDNSIEAAIGREIATTIRELEIPITMEEPKADPVNHPAHYKYGGIETIDFIEAKELGYNLGNVVKYVTRADHKGNRKQDLEKAMWYLQRELTHST